MYRHEDDAPWYLTQAVFPVALAALLGYGLLSAERVTIKVSPYVVMAGGTVRVTCRVPRHPENRRLTIGLSNYRESQRDLEGEYAPVTHEVTYEHVPCETDLAYCAVEDSAGRGAVARQNLTVAGCDATSSRR